MNKQLISMIMTLLLLQPAVIFAKTDSNEIAKPKTSSMPDTTLKLVAEATTGPKKKSALPEKVFEPINAAFGIPLGKKFEAGMVKKVLSEESQTYSGKDGEKLKGTIYQVEPNKPDERFQKYTVKTTADGIIYTIKGEYQFETEMAKGKQAGKVKNQRTLRKTCKAVVKKLASELEAMHGKPRGQGYDGEWFSFRQSSETSNKSLRLYANRCRTGLYSIIYIDKLAQKAVESK